MSLQNNLTSMEKILFVKVNIAKKSQKITAGLKKRIRKRFSHTRWRKTTVRPGLENLIWKPDRVFILRLCFCVKVDTGVEIPWVENQSFCMVFRHWWCKTYLENIILGTCCWEYYSFCMVFNTGSIHLRILLLTPVLRNHSFYMVLNTGGGTPCVENLILDTCFWEIILLDNF